MWLTIGEATRKITQKALDIEKFDLKQIKMSHPDIFYVQYNMFNDYYMALRHSSELFVIELTERTTSKEGTFMALLILSAISITVAMCILFPVLITVNKTKEEVLSLFLDIPETTVKVLYLKCEQFISSL